MPQIPEITVNLRLPPEERWAELLVDYEDETRAVLESVEEEVESWGLGALTWITMKALGLFRRINHAHDYVREINAIADGLGVDRDLLYAANLGYDLSSWTGTHSGILNRIPGIRRLFGCTGFIHWPYLARNMDWDWPAGIGEYSMLFRFVNGRKEFLTVGFPGHIGVISGLSRSFGLTLNQAFSARIIPRWTAMPVTWQVRSILERAQTFSGAERILTTERTLTGAFYLLCGNKKGEAILVESSGDQDVVTEGHVAIANHFLSDEKVDDELEDSYERLEAIEQRISSCPKMTVTAAKRILSREPVLNDDTVHQMVMEPGVMHLRCPYLSNRWRSFRLK